MVGSFRLVAVVAVVVVVAAAGTRNRTGVVVVVVVVAVGIGNRTGVVISPSGGCFLLHEFIENRWADKLVFSRTWCRGAIAALRLWLNRFLNNIERIEQTLLVHTG